MSSRFRFSCRIEPEQTSEYFDEFSQSSKVGKLVGSIALRFGLDEKDFFLVHKGKILADETKELDDYRVNSGDTVTLHRRADLQHLNPETSSLQPSNVQPSTLQSITLQPTAEGPTLLPSSAGVSACEPIHALDKSACPVCESFESPQNQDIVCEECLQWWHWACLSPPLTSLPDGDWYCSNCINDFDAVVRPDNEKNFTRANKKPLLNYGKGRRTCPLPATHRGHIPGISVGQTWQFRNECSQDGVHRPPVSGIAGTASNGGAVSISLNGGYSSDQDNGDWFIYTGSGGFDSTKSRKQVNDQSFDRSNLAIAATCDSKLNEKGAAARDWRMSKPIRVLRGYKSGPHAPTQGFRYDGLYKVVRYWKTEPKYDGCTRYLFEFRRDDDTPLPWTPAGEQMIHDLGLQMVPRHGTACPAETLCIGEPQQEPGPTTESSREITTRWHVPKPVRNAIAEAILATPSHERLLQPLLEHTFGSKYELVNWLHENMSCPICKELVNSPVTAPCGHIACLRCIKLSCKSDFGCCCPLCFKSLLGSTSINSCGESAWAEKLERKTFLNLVEVDSILANVLSLCFSEKADINRTDNLESMSSRTPPISSGKDANTTGDDQNEDDEQKFRGMNAIGAGTVGATETMGFREKQTAHFNHHITADRHTVMGDASHHMHHLAKQPDGIAHVSESVTPANIQVFNPLKRTKSPAPQDDEGDWMAGDRGRPRPKLVRGPINGELSHHVEHFGREWLM